MTAWNNSPATAGVATWRIKLTRSAAATSSATTSAVTRTSTPLPVTTLPRKLVFALIEPLRPYKTI
jgi:hypothetical protein